MSFKIISLLLLKPRTVLYYKIENISLSLITTITYIKFFILLIYFLCIYNVPHSLDLKQYYYFVKDATLPSSIPFVIKINLYIIGLLLGLSIVLLFLWFHRRMYKEIHRIFIYFCYRDYLVNNKYTKKIYNTLHKISIYDPLQYCLDELTFYLTNRLNGRDHEFVALPWYHFRKIYSKLFSNKYYVKIMKISPIIILLYDCIFNHFVLYHIYYYLLFYIPFRLFHRASSAVGSNSYYLNLLVWEACYGKRKWLYAIPEKYKFFLDQYLALELSRNYDLSIDTELFLYDHTRFGLIDKRQLIYENPDGVQIQRVGNKYFEITENDDSEVVFADEWYLIVDKTHT